MQWVLRCLFGMLLFQGWAMASAVQADDRPNVVIILTDDQGWADVGYNNSRVYTPNIDRLAASGATLTQYYVMPQCTPTRVALLTGRYPGRFGRQALAANNAPAFPKETLTLAKRFQDMGYETALCGKWHLGSTVDHGPNCFGFDESYGSLTGAVGMYDHRYRIGKFEQAWHRNHQPIPGNEDGKHATDLVTEDAIRFIERERSNPFFLYVPFHSVHTPLDERGSFVDQPTQLDPQRPERWINEDQIPWFHDPDGKIQAETDPEKRLFLAALNHLDDAVGRILKALDETGQRDNTLIIYSSDNGPQVNWGGNAYPNDLKLTDFNQSLPFRGKKTDVWEGGIHVPGFVTWPGRIEPQVIDDPIHIVDWWPTLNAFVNQPHDATPELDGIDLLPRLLGHGVLPSRDLYWIWNSRTNRWALRYKQWKIVKLGTAEPSSPDDWQLFNLNDDPREKSNVAMENPEILAAMHERFVVQRAKDKRRSVEDEARSEEDKPRSEEDEPRSEEDKPRSEGDNRQSGEDKCRCDESGR